MSVCLSVTSQCSIKMVELTVLDFGTVYPPRILHCVSREFGYLQTYGYIPLELCPKFRTWKISQLRVDITSVVNFGGRPMWENGDGRRSPVYHTECPPLCTTRWAQRRALRGLSEICKNCSAFSIVSVRGTHTPTLRPHATRFHELRISSMAFTSAHLYGNVYMRVGVARALADSSDFGLLGAQSSPKWEIPCLGRQWTAVQNVTPLALSSAKKSITVQTHTHSHTQTNSNRYIHTLLISMCG